MKLEMQMKDSDKKLLIFLAIFVIVVGIGYWGIKPQIQSILKSHEEMEDEEYRQMIDDVKLAELPMLEIENTNLEKDILDARSHFYKMMTSDEVDKYMTGMVIGYNLYSYSLSITMPTEEAKLEAYMYSDKYEADQRIKYEKMMEEAEAQDSVDTSDGLTEKEQLALLEPESYEDNGEGLAGIYAVGVSMELGGEREDLQRLIDDLSVSKDKIWLRSYNWSSTRVVEFNEETGLYEESFRPGLYISVNLYMCEE